MPDRAVMATLLARFAPHLGIAALALIAGLCVQNRLLSGQRDVARAAMMQARTSHEADLARIRAAQALLNARHLADIDAMKTDYRRRQDDTDRQPDSLRAAYYNRVLRIAPARADQAGGGTIAMPGAVPAQSTDRSGGDAILLARSDALICATNTARLQTAHDWAKGLASMALPD